MKIGCIFKPTIVIFFLLIVKITDVYPQNILQGEWHDHLSYRTCLRIAETPEWIYCASESGLISYNKNTNDTRKHSKVTGLSDVLINTIAYSEETDYLIVGYVNGNIDLLREGQTPINLTDIKRRIMTTDKRINKILTHGHYVYLACGFGIVVLNLENVEVKETYYLGESGTYLNVNDIAIANNILYAATESGIYKADLDSPNLLDYSNWSRLEFLPQALNEYTQIENHQNTLFAVYSDMLSGHDNIITFNENDYHPWTYYSDTTINDLYSSNGYLTIAAPTHGTIFNENNIILHDFTAYGVQHIYVSDQGTFYAACTYNGFISLKEDNTFRYYSINGPRYSKVTRVAAKSNHIWVTTGAPATLNSQRPCAIYSNIDGKWTSYTHENNQLMYQTGNTYKTVFDPSNINHLFVGTFGYGIIEILDGEIINLYRKDDNEIFSGIRDAVKIRTSGIQFDAQNRLWVLLDLVSNPLFILDQEGNWENPHISNSILNSNNVQYYDLLITSRGQIWVLTFNAQIIVLEEEAEGLYRQKTFFIKNQYETLINKANCLEEDNEGNIWVGTNNGPVIYYSPWNVFQLSEVNGYQIPIPRNDGTNNVDLFLYSEAVLDIKTDGGNRKWFATAHSGVFLTSPDGKETLVNFRDDNSPLLSNGITGIDINEKSGEVFIATDLGLVSYGGIATTGFDDYSNVYVYPNPIRREYDGPITVTGLVENSIVKITDINGILVWETKSLGGQAVWDGRNFKGDRVATGVYLIMLATEDGLKSHITKLLFMH